MTDARIEEIYADRLSARDFIDQADRLRSDADVDGLSAEAQAILVHSAAVCACDAILQAVGRRVTSGDASHVLRLEAALDELDCDTEELLEKLDASRERRNEASYAASPISAASLIEAREATTELLALARSFVGG